MGRIRLEKPCLSAVYRSLPYCRAAGTPNLLLRSLSRPDVIADRWKYFIQSSRQENELKYGL